VLLKTRGGDPQLVSCKVAGRSHGAYVSCRRANMEEKTASTAISSHEAPSLVPALNTSATSLAAHNPVCDSCMCDWLTGRPDPARWEPVELPCITQWTFTPTISYFWPNLCFVSAVESVDRCLSSAFRPQSAADLAHHASLEAPRFFGRFTVPPRLCSHKQHFTREVFEKVAPWKTSCRREVQSECDNEVKDNQWISWISFVF